jgi:hypothetical protein
MAQVEQANMADWVVLLAQTPGSPPKPAGILLLDRAQDQLHVALLEAGAVSADEDIQEIWDALPQDLQQQSTAMGGGELFAKLEEDLSHFLQIQGPRQQIATDDPERTLADLFDRHVAHGSDAMPI